MEISETPPSCLQVVFQKKIMAAKRKHLNLEEKMSVVDTAEKNKLSLRQLASQFQVSKTQISQILKRRVEIKKMYAENRNVRRKRMFIKTEGVAIDAAVFDWYSEIRKKDILLSGRQIKEKAVEVAGKLNMKLKGSNGWLDKFCHRHNIVLKNNRSNSKTDDNEDNVKSYENGFSSITYDYLTKRGSLDLGTENFITNNCIKSEDIEIKEENCENDIYEDNIDNCDSEDGIRTTIKDINEAYLSLKNIENYFTLTEDFVGAQKIAEVLMHVGSEMMRDYCSLY